MTQYNENNSISIIWSIEDVKGVRPDLNNDQCMKVLRMVEDNHDANHGVNWDEIEGCADYLYPWEESE